jgi:hypothetical protein
VWGIHHDMGETGTAGTTVGETAGPQVAVASRLGLSAGDVVGEVGYDEDVDHELRDAVADVVQGDLLDDDADEVLDAVLLWWRSDDGDLTDALVDNISLLADDGVIWLLTPKTGHAGHVDPSEIAEATTTAGLSQTTSMSAGPGWVMARLVRPRSAKSKR